MAESQIKVHSAYLTSKDKLDDRFLFAGKVDKPKFNGFFFYIIEILSPWFPSSKVKKEILAVLEQATDEEGNEIFFESTIVKINEALDQLTQSGEKEWIGNLNALVGLVSENDLYIAQTGTIAGYIFRKGNISAITEKNIPASAPLPINTFTDITNGIIVKGDRLVFGNTELYNHLSLDRIKSFSENRSSRELILDIDRFFKRLKNTSVNALSIEANSREEIEGRELNDLPEVFYIDQAEETILAKTKKTLKPVYEKSKVYSGKLVENIKVCYHHLKEKRVEKHGAQITQSHADYSNTDTPPEGKTERHSGISVNKYSDKSKPVINVLNKILKLTTNFITKSLLPENRKYLYAVLIVIILSFGYLKIKENNEAKTKQNEQLSISESYDRAKELYSKAKDDLSLGKSEGLTELVDALALAQKAATKDAMKEKATILIRDINKTLDQKTGTTRSYDQNALFDFNNTVSASIAVGMEIFIINPEGKIFSSNTREKEVTLVSSIGKTNGEAIDISYTKTGNKLVILTNGQKVLTFDIAAKTFNAEKNADTDKWEEADKIQSYVSNIYLLDKINGEVWKHTESATGFSKGSAYLDTRKVGIKEAVGFAIDGDIYILQADSSVAKFSKGAVDAAFSIKGLPVPYDKIESPTQIFTDADTPYLYILDKKMNRIVRFSKEGVFNRQYIIDGVLIDKFYVNSKSQKVWALSGSKIYEIDI